MTLFSIMGLYQHFVSKSSTHLFQTLCSGENNPENNADRARVSHMTMGELLLCLLMKYILILWLIIMLLHVCGGQWDC